MNSHKTKTSKTNKGEKAKNKSINNNSNNNKIIQLLTVEPELVSLDCSLTHVLQVPNTQSYHS